MVYGNKNIRYNIDGHHYGLFIREARLRKELTLAQVASGLCDASFLSKIESGHASPKKEVLMKVFDKLEIEMPLQGKKCPIRIFRKCLNISEESAINMKVTNEMYHHYEIQLINFFKAVLKNELHEALKMKKLIGRLEGHLHPHEKQLFLFFCAIYHFKNFEWDKGNKAFKKSNKILRELQISDPYLEYFFAQQYFKMKKPILGYFHLGNAIEEYNKIYAKNWILKCELLLCEELIKGENFVEASKHLEKIEFLLDEFENELYRKEFWSLKGMILERQGKNIQAEEYLLKSIEPVYNDIDERCFLNTSRFYYNQANYEKLIKLIEKTDIRFFKQHTKILIEYYYFKATNDSTDEFESFLQKDAIPFSIREMDSEAVLTYVKELSKILRHKQKYKKAADAYLKWMQFCDKIDSIEKF